MALLTTIMLVSCMMLATGTGVADEVEGSFL
jgi:hypothetical protein